MNNAEEQNEQETCRGFENVILEVDVERIEQLESEEDITKSLANFIVKTQESNKLCEKVIFSIVDETISLIERQ